MSANLITHEGYEELKKELDFLWREERPAVTRIVQWAASLGDRSENADYQYNKKRLREIDRRVRYLRGRISDLRVVEYSEAQEGKVFFGAWVTLVGEEGESLSFRIVGVDEIYGKKNYISINSPVARACIGKGVGDEVFVITPDATKCWEVDSITYEGRLKNRV